MVRARLLLLAPLSVVAALPPVTVPTISLGGGVELPYVAMGTGSGQKGDVEKATALWLGEAGGSAIDTAYEYFDQPEVAKGISAAGLPRSAVFLETKIPCSNYETATKDLESNLKQLAVRKVDLTLIHTTCSAAGASGTWKALEEFHAAGKSDAIGVSHFQAADFEALKNGGAKVVPQINQCKLSVVYYDSLTIEYCKKNGIVYQSFSPLCGGFNGSSCSRGGSGKNVMTVPQVVSIAKAHNVSAAQIGLKWIVQQGFPLTTAVWELDYMQEDLDLWSWGNLTATEMATLSKVAGPPDLLPQPRQ